MQSGMKALEIPAREEPIGVDRVAGHDWPVLDGLGSSAHRSVQIGSQKPIPLLHAKCTRAARLYHVGHVLGDEGARLPTVGRLEVDADSVAPTNGVRQVRAVAWDDGYQIGSGHHERYLQKAGRVQLQGGELGIEPAVDRWDRRGHWKSRSAGQA